MIRDAKVVEAYVSDLLDSMPDASFMVNSTGGIVLVNALAEKMFGYESRELRGKSIGALVPERFRRVHADHCLDYFTRPRTRAMGAGLSLRALRKDGTELPVEISLSPIKTDQGIFVLGAIRDISQSEERYRAMFEQVAVGVAHSNSEGRLLNVNPKFCEISGYTREEALALDIRELTHPDDVAKTIEARARALAGTSSTYEGEARLIRKGGTEIWASITTSLVRGADGRPVHFISLIHDISPQKRAEEERRESERRFSNMLQNVELVAMMLDRDACITYCNDYLLQLTGWTREEISGRNWFEVFVPPENREELKGIFVSLLANLPDAWHYENEILTRSRERRRVRWNNTILRSPSGAVVGTASIGEDITERRRAEAALEESEARFRGMIEQSISGTCIIDADYRFAYVNPRLAVILGYESPAPINGRPVLEFVAAEDHALVAENMRQRVAGETQSARYHFQAIRKDGSRVTLGAHGTIGFYGGKQVVIATVQDVTELRRAEEEIGRTVAKLRRAVDSTIEVVSTMGEMRDAYTHGHERRVGEVATAIATELGLSADRIEGVRVAGYLHDVGKIAVPAEILSKPTRLSKAEFELVKQHAQQSYEILKGMEFPWPVAAAAWQHHERLDGSGYPRQLKGEQIILEARILAVADTVEAMASHRPYRPGLGIDVALAEIETNRGTLYDVAVADACLSLFRVKGYGLPV